MKTPTENYVCILYNEIGLYSISTLCSVECKTSSEITQQLMDRLQEDKKKSNRDFHDDTRRIHLTARHSLEFQWVFAQAVSVGFVCDLSFLLLSEIVENTCYKDKIQNMKTDHFPRKMSQTKLLGTLENHSSGLVFHTAYFQGTWKTIVLIKASQAHPQAHSRDWRDSLKGVSWPTAINTLDFPVGCIMCLLIYIFIRISSLYQISA